MGVLFGCYRFEHDSKSEFREWSVDIPGEFARDLLKKLQKGARSMDRIDTVYTFVREHCPKWADWVKVKGR
jgi:hypothetical protein